MASKRTTIRLKGELLEMAKRRAAEQGRTLTAFIEDAVRAEITRAPKPQKLEPLIVSKETGGPLPGVDLIRTGALEDMLDIEKWREFEAQRERERQSKK